MLINLTVMTHLTQIRCLTLVTRVKLDTLNHLDLANEILPVGGGEAVIFTEAPIPSFESCTVNDKAPEWLKR
jgi:hypothetical protein